MGQGVIGKFLVIGIKNRETNQVIAKAIDATDNTTLHDFIYENTSSDAIFYTDEHRGYNNLYRKHATVSHSKHPYADGDAHINGIESFWAILKKAYKGTYHFMSRKYVQLYVNEFVWRYNTRSVPMMERMGLLLR